MFFAVDLWHKNWGFGFSLIIWERFEDPLGLMKIGFEWQIKLFGRTWGTGNRS